MNRFPIAADRLGSVQFLKAEPKLDFDTKQQKLRDGVPQHTVTALVMSDDSKPELALITVTAASLPEIPAMTEIDLPGLIGLHWSQNGKSGVALSADGVAPKGSGNNRRSLPGE